MCGRASSIRLFRDRLRDVAIVIGFWRESAKIGIPDLHSMRWYSTTDERFATRMHALTPPMITLRPIKMC